MYLATYYDYLLIPRKRFHNHKVPLLTKKSTQLGWYNQFHDIARAELKKVNIFLLKEHLRLMR